MDKNETEKKEKSRWGGEDSDTSLILYPELTSGPSTQILCVGVYSDFCGTIYYTFRSYKEFNNLKKKEKC